MRGAAHLSAEKPSPPHEMSPFFTLLQASSFTHFLSGTSNKGRLCVILSGPHPLCVMGAGDNDNNVGEIRTSPSKSTRPLRDPQIGNRGRGGRCITDIPTQLALNSSSINGNFNEKLSLD